MYFIKKICRMVDEIQARNRVYRLKRVLINNNVNGWRDTDFRGNNVVGTGANFSAPVEIGYGTTIGPYNVITGPVTIGRYCQFGQFVGVYGQDHPISYLTTYINQSLFDGRLRNNLQRAPIHIGSGVWVGHGAVILKGVHIGDGAIIAAGAVVTKDVPPYTIAVGNPSRNLRTRLSPDIIKILEEVSWHNLEKSEL